MAVRSSDPLMRLKMKLKQSKTLNLANAFKKKTSKLMVKPQTPILPQLDPDQASGVSVASYEDDE